MKQIWSAVALLAVTGSAHAAFSDYSRWLTLTEWKVEQSNVTGTSELFTLNGRQYERFNLTISPTAIGYWPIQGFSLRGNLSNQAFLTHLHLGELTYVIKHDYHDGTDPEIGVSLDYFHQLGGREYSVGKLFETVAEYPLVETTTETRPYLYTQTFRGAFGGPEQAFYSSLKAWQMGCCNSFTVPEIELSFVANPVPEPETYALMGTGLLAGLLVRRRKQLGKSQCDEVQA